MTETRQKKIKIELFKEQETYTIYNGSMLEMSYEYDVIKEQQQAKQRGQASIFDFMEG